MGACRSSACAAMGAAASGGAAGKQGPLEEVPLDSPEWAEVERLVRERSKRYHLHYRRSAMRIQRLWRIRPNDLFQEYRYEASRLGEPMSLFHGTSPESAKRIVESGFQLPQTSGMFGKGVYFARCPLKSVGYARLAGFLSKAWGRLFRRRGPTGEKRVMLLCDVYLGRSKVLRQANNRLSSAGQLRPSCLGRICWPNRKYDSVYAPGGGQKSCCHAVRVTEYIIYDPKQAIPRYVIEFDIESVKGLKGNSK